MSASPETRPGLGLLRPTPDPCNTVPWIYQNRNLVERFWSRVKEWRAVATRYEKTERSFMGVLCMATTMDWLKA
jgi:transposase